MSVRDINRVIRVKISPGIPVLIRRADHVLSSYLSRNL